MDETLRVVVMHVRAIDYENIWSFAYVSILILEYLTNQICLIYCTTSPHYNYNKL